MSGISPRRKKDSRKCFCKPNKRWNNKLTLKASFVSVFCSSFGRFKGSFDFLLVLKRQNNCLDFKVTMDRNSFNAFLQLIKYLIFSSLLHSKITSISSSYRTTQFFFEKRWKNKTASSFLQTKPFQTTPSLSIRASSIFMHLFSIKNQRFIRFHRYL
jgi:hypothetical protein